MIKQAIKKGLFTSDSIFIDATHTCAQGECRSPSQTLRHLTRRLRKKIYIHMSNIAKYLPEKPERTATIAEEMSYTKALLRVIKKQRHEDGYLYIKKQIAQLEELIKEEKVNDIVILSDPEAKRGYKARNKLFIGYKTHLAMTQDRMITAITVTSGEKPD